MEHGEKQNEYHKHVAYTYPDADNGGV